MYNFENLCQQLNSNRLTTLDLHAAQMPDYLKTREQKTLSGHSSIVYALALLADGRLASGSADKTIKVWEAPPQLSDEQQMALLAALGENHSVQTLDRSP